MGVLKYDREEIKYAIGKYMQSYDDGEMDFPTIQDFSYIIKIPMRSLYAIMRMDDEINDAMAPVVCMLEKVIAEKTIDGTINHQTAQNFLKQPFFGYVDKSLVLKDETTNSFELSDDEAEQIATAPIERVAEIYRELMMARERR